VGRPLRVVEMLEGAFRGDRMWKLLAVFARDRWVHKREPDDSAMPKRSDYLKGDEEGSLGPRGIIAVLSGTQKKRQHSIECRIHQPKKKREP